MKKSLLCCLLLGCQVKGPTVPKPSLSRLQETPVAISVPLPKRDGPFPRLGDQDITRITYLGDAVLIEVTTPARATFGIEWSTNLLDWTVPVTWHSNDSGRMAVPFPTELPTKFFRVTVDHDP